MFFGTSVNQQCYRTKSFEMFPPILRALSVFVTDMFHISGFCTINDNSKKNTFYVLYRFWPNKLNNNKYKFKFIYSSSFPTAIIPDCCEHTLVEFCSAPFF